MGKFFSIRRRPIVSIIDVKGPISIGDGRVSLAALADDIDYAFKPKSLDAVLLKINSPGGSPAQAEMIHRRIRILATLRRVPVYASIEDMATSAGYWIALAADHIVAQETSIIGSISTASYRFGFDKLLDRLGIERRIYASGLDKTVTDPFKPEDARGREMIVSVQQDIHETFTSVVLQRRGAKLKASADDLFTGAVWSGRHAVKLGLIDGVADIRGVLNVKFGTVPRIRAPKRRRSSQKPSDFDLSSVVARLLHSGDWRDR